MYRQFYINELFYCLKKYSIYQTVGALHTTICRFSYAIQYIPYFYPLTMLKTVDDLFFETHCTVPPDKELSMSTMFLRFLGFFYNKLVNTKYCCLFIWFVCAVNNLLIGYIRQIEVKEDKIENGIKH